MRRADGFWKSLRARSTPSRLAALLLVGAIALGGASASDFAHGAGSSATVWDVPNSLLNSIAVDAHGDVYTVDVHRSHLLKYSPAGRLLGTWSARCGGFVNAVALDRSGNVYTADGGCVEKRSPSGTVLSSWRVACCVALAAIDSRGNIYLSDTIGFGLRKLSPAGKSLVYWHVQPESRCDAGAITGLAVGTSGEITVALSDITRTKSGSLYGSHALVTLTSSGKRKNEWAWDRAGVGRLDGPRGLALDAQGNIYVADTASDSIQKISPTGKLLKRWGSQGSGPLQFDRPMAVALGPHNDLYVAESGGSISTGNHRIQIFSQSA